MEKTEIKIQREQRRIRRKAIQCRVNELIAWLSENKASNEKWDANVRELNAYELKLEMMDQPVRKTNCVDYGVSLNQSIQFQY